MQQKCNKTATAAPGLGFFAAYILHAERKVNVAVCRPSVWQNKPQKLHNRLVGCRKGSSSNPEKTFFVSRNRSLWPNSSSLVRVDFELEYIIAKCRTAHEAFTVKYSIHNKHSLAMLDNINRMAHRQIRHPKRK